MVCRKVRRIELETKRKIRDTNTFNGRRRQKYEAMHSLGKLGHEELIKYEEWRVAILGERKGFERRRISIPSLPSENPTRTDYDLARKLYHAYICPECEED